MHGLHLWRAAGLGAPHALAPGLTACVHLLERASAAAAAAAATAAAAAEARPEAGAAGHAVGGSGSGRGGCSHGAANSRAVAVAGDAGAESGSGSGSAAGSGFGTSSSASRSGAAGGHDGGGGGGGSRRDGRWRWGRWRTAGGNGTGGGGGGGSGGGSAYGVGAAAAAAATGFAAAALASTALADAPSGQPLQEALAAAQRELHAAWGEVEEELARINARLPAHAPGLKGEPPTASEVHGAVEVVVPIREGADVNAVLRELRQGLGGQGSTSYSESVYGASRTVRMEIRQPGGGTLRVMMFVPPPGGSEQAQVVVSKRGAFSEEELTSLRRTVRAANVSFGLDQPARGSAARRHGLHGGTDAEAHARAMDDMFDALARNALAGLIAGPMQHLFSELQRELYQGAQGDEEGEDGEGAAPGGLGGGLGGFGGGGPFPPGLPLPPSVQHRRRGQLDHDRGGGSSSAGGHDWGSPAAARAVEQLLAMGAQVFPPGSKDKMDWEVLAGYEEQKRTIEDCLLLPLLRPDVYAKLARATRKTFANNRPRAVLFEGPPGTGKTTSARVISSQAAVPLIYLPLEAVLSKWYGESEQQLGAVFKAAEAMGGAIIFLDELDALGGNREAGGLHEVSRRLLSVLLREMEGFDADTKRTVVIGATNRKTDLDPALLSRFDLLITFGLPDAACRRLILRQYAQQLSEGEVGQLAERTGGMSGRDLRDVCEHTERRWASKIIRGEVREEDLPPLAEYLASADERATAVQHVQQAASAAGALNRLLGAAGGGRPSLPSWLTGSGQQ